MTYQIAAVLNTYFTRRWMMLGLALGALFVTVGLIGVSFTTRQTLEPMMVMQLVALPTMLVLTFLVQHAKWQFVHSRARLMPNYAEAHLLVLFTLLMLAVVVYPLVASRLLNISSLGIMAFVMLLGGTVAWAIHTMRPLFVLAYMALFCSFLLPSIVPLWLADEPRYSLPRWGLLALGTLAVGLWLRRLPRMTEEAEDYVIPVQGNMGASRMEKSEARRVMVLTLSRARLHMWLADRWHDRLAALSPHDEASRPQLLRYGFAPVSAPVRALFFIFLAIMVGLTQSVIVSGLNSSDAERGLNAARSGAMIATMAMLAFMAPVLMSQLTATRMPRLAQELLLPMSRRALVSGLVRTVGGEMAMLAVLGGVLMLAGAMLLTPDLVTVTNTTAMLMALVSVQPLMFAISFAASLIRSAIARLLLMVGLLYVVLGCAAGVFALGYYISLTGAGIVALGLFLGGMGLIRVARSMWMRAELGR